MKNSLVFKAGNTQQDRIHILEKMSVHKAIWVLALPTMASMLIQVVYNMIDTFFIGKLNDPYMVAAITISMPIFLIIQSFGNIFAYGGASLISRLLGQGEREKARKAGAVSFWSAFVVCTLVSILAFFLLEPILLLCGASENTLGYGKSYLIFMLIGSPFIGMQVALSGLLRSEGAVKVSMMGIVAGSVLNMILDPIFILLLGWDVKGAAIATSISNICIFLFYLRFYLKNKGILSVSLRYYRFSGRIYADILKIGIPASLGIVLMSAGIALANYVAAGFGDSALAATGIVMRIALVAVMLVFGLAQGCQPLMGYSYGAKNFSRLMETVKRAAGISTIIGVVFAVLLAVFSGTWIRIFINNAVVIELGAQYIKALVLSMPLLGIQLVIIAMFQSIGKPIESLILYLGRQGFFFIPALFIFSSLWGYSGFVYAMPFSDVATTLLAGALFLFMRKKLIAQPD